MNVQQPKFEHPKYLIIITVHIFLIIMDLQENQAQIKKAMA